MLDSDGELELEARWGDFEFENEPFSDPDSEEKDDFDLGPHYSAMELKKLDARRRIRKCLIRNCLSLIPGY